jgi:exosortase
MTANDATRKIDPKALAWWLSSRATHISAAFLWLLSLALFWQPWRSLATLSFHDENSSHILLIPIMSAGLIYLERRRVFKAPRYCPSIGIPLLLLTVVLWYTLRTPLSSLNNTDRLSVTASLIILVWLSVFILCYGTTSLRAAGFPLFFLLLMIPLPVALAEHTISILQKGSAETCYALFRLLGVPVIRHGFRFSLPGADIEVAEQCSGIHAGLSLFIAGLLAEHILLQDAWKKACFVLCIFPIAIFKNAVRIVTIAWLGIYVNPGFFHGPLHRRGGIPFSLLALALMGFLLWLLRPIAFSRMRHEPQIGRWRKLGKTT